MFPTIFRAKLALPKSLGITQARIQQRRNLHSLPSIPHLPQSRYTICDNADSTAHAHSILLDAPYVLFDCEGHHSKTPNGSPSLSTIQLGTPHASEIFIFDMLSLAQRSTLAVSRILSLIADAEVVKVGWGGVEDYKTLARVYGRTLCPFLDLQIVDVHSRVRRKEGREKRVARLASEVFPKEAIERLKLCLDGVHALSRMDRALLEHKVTNVPLKESHTSRWSERPLTESDIRYAANDILRISELYNRFKHTGKLPTKLLADVIAQSEMHNSLHGPSGILNIRRHFVPHNILPHDIINVSIGDNTFFTKNRDLWRCKRCHRTLSRECFALTDGGTRNGAGHIGNADVICNACTFLLKKEQYIFQSAALKAKEFAMNLVKKSRELMG